MRGRYDPLQLLATEREKRLIWNVKNIWDIYDAVKTVQLHGHDLRDESRSAAYLSALYILFVM